MINDKQKIALEILWCQHKVPIVAHSTRFGIHPAVLVGLVGAYGKLATAGFFSPNTAWHERGWISDAITPERARYGLTQVKLSLANSLKLEFDVTRKVLSVPDKCFFITARILSQIDYMKPSAMLEHWHGADVPNSLRYKFRGALSYFSKTLLDEEDVDTAVAPLESVTDRPRALPAGGVQECQKAG